MLSAIKYRFLASLSSIWKAIGLCLVIFSLLLIASCGGGGGGGGPGGGGLEADWSIFPSERSLEIHWHNYAIFNQSGVRNFTVETIITGTDDETRSLAVSASMGQLVRDMGIFDISTGLMNGDTVKFDSRISLGYSNDVSGTATAVIEWRLSQNRQDHTAGGVGILVGPNHDGDGWADARDTDDDNDGVPDARPDGCPQGATGRPTNSDPDRDGNGCRDRTEEVSLSAIPFVDPDKAGLIILWHDYATFNQSGVRHFTVETTVNGNTPGSYSATMVDIIEQMGIVNYTSDLMDRDRVKFNQVSLEFNSSLSTTAAIKWQLEANRGDHAADSDGILVGSNHDGDGWADARDLDDDNDGVLDEHPDICLSPVGWKSDSSTDRDGDGCRDSDEDDDPQVAATPLIYQGTRCAASGVDDCDKDGVDDVEEVARRCIILPDCDGDGLEDGVDSCPAGRTGWTSGRSNDRDGDGCHNDEDIDDDGDRLIEVGTPAELNEVRYQLDGTGRKESDTAPLDQTGCGDDISITACNGYELVADIDLSSFRDGRGWLPVMRDQDGDSNCSQDPFTGIFDGNGHIVSGLFINRSGETCVGLFGNVQSATIRDVGVIAHNIIGKLNIGGLVGGDLGDSSIIQSFVVADQIRGEREVGGLIGKAKDTKIVGSYAVTRMLHSISRSVGYIGGLVGNANERSSRIVQSYAVSSSIRSETNYAGGLIGSIGSLTKIIQSYAVSESVYANTQAAGLVGRVVSGSPEIIQSYTVTGSITTNFGLAAIVSGAMSSVQASYWDSTTSGIKSRTTGEGAGAEPKTSLNLTTPTGYSGIYAAWDGGSMIDDVRIAALNTTGTIYCDTDLSGMIEAGEQQNNRVWDFGTDTDYPAIRCTPNSLADQRAWWYLDAMGKPELNTTLLDDWLDGSPP